MPQKKQKQEQDLILNKHVGLIHCENKLTLVERKICNALLFNAIDHIDKKEIFEIELKRLCSLIGYNSNDIDLVKKSLKRLISITMEWNLLEKEKSKSDPNDEQTLLQQGVISWHASSLLAGASIQRGLVKYSYSPQIKSILSSLDVYGRINLFVQSKFRSSYSLVLYENCVRFKNIAKTGWIDIEIFRKLMGIEEDKYPDFKELNRNVIKVAVNEINDKSDIVIEPELKRVRRSVIALRFLIRENVKFYPAIKKKQHFDRLPVIDQNKEDKLIASLKEHLAISPDKAKEIILNYGEAKVYECLQYFRQHPQFISGKISNKWAYFLKVLENRSGQTTVTRQPSFDILQEINTQTEQAGLHRKYTDYKINLLKKVFENAPDKMHKMILENFARLLQTENQALWMLYQKRGIAAPAVAHRFYEYINVEDPTALPHYLSYDDFLTAETVEIEV